MLRGKTRPARVPPYSLPGLHMNTWPDAAWSPFHGEKNTNWEGGWRVPAQQYVGKFLQTFPEFPPRQKPASFSIDQVMEKLAPPSG